MKTLSFIKNITKNCLTDFLISCLISITFTIILTGNIITSEIYNSISIENILEDAISKKNPMVLKGTEGLKINQSWGSYTLKAYFKFTLQYPDI